MNRSLVATWAVAILSGLYGCAQHAIQVADNARPVIRETNWKQWKNFTPLQTIAFGHYKVTAPKRRRTKTDESSILLTKFEKIRQEGGADFQVSRDNVPVASVSARSRLKQRRLDTKIGKLNYAGDDLLDGTVTLASGQQAAFEVKDFHERASRSIAEGRLVIGEQVVEIHEIEAPFVNQKRGFAGAEFFHDGRRISQVLRYGDEHVWVDECLPENIRDSVAAVAATLLIVKRLDPSEHDQWTEQQKLRRKR